MATADLHQRIRNDLDAARRERDRDRVSLLTMLLSEIRNREIEIGGEADDAEVEGVVTGAIKRRKEAAEQMRSAGRVELAEKEEREAEALQGYLPPPLSEEEVMELIRVAVEEGAGDLGSVMRAVMPATRGRFEGKEVSRLAREALS
jgi:uncharacterized protein